jgi:hypothetical protein
MLEETTHRAFLWLNVSRVVWADVVMTLGIEHTLPSPSP